MVASDSSGEGQPGLPDADAHLPRQPEEGRRLGWCVVDTTAGGECSRAVPDSSLSSVALPAYSERQRRRLAMTTSESNNRGPRLYGLYVQVLLMVLRCQGAPTRNVRPPAPRTTASLPAGGGGTRHPSHSYAKGTGSQRGGRVGVLSGLPEGRNPPRRSSKARPPIRAPETSSFSDSNFLAVNVEIHTTTHAFLKRTPVHRRFHTPRVPCTRLFVRVVSFSRCRGSVVGVDGTNARAAAAGLPRGRCATRQSSFGAPFFLRSLFCWLSSPPQPPPPPPSPPPRPRFLVAADRHLFRHAVRRPSWQRLCTGEPAGACLQPAPRSILPACPSCPRCS